MRRFTLVVWVAVAASCASSDPSECESDAECTIPGTRCLVEERRCVCKSDESCADGEFCNTAGACQKRPGCSVNSDCAALAGTLCDLGTGICIAAGSCGGVPHCPFGTLCTGSACAAGCFDDGDCVLGQICDGGACRGGAGTCADDSFCTCKERCVNGECQRDRRGPYCKGCSDRSIMNPEPCEAPKNFCLTNTAEETGFDRICGVDCSLGQPCPNCYACVPVFVTPRICQSQAQCKCLPTAGNPNPIGRACQTDQECAGGQCVAGFCCGGDVREDLECIGNEGAVRGGCTCSTDDDCPAQTCDRQRGACVLTGEPCTRNQDCRNVPCVNRTCQIGQNCAPIEGVTCSFAGGRS